MSIDTGFGTTITFQSGFFATIREVSMGGAERPEIDTSHAGTSNGERTFIPSDLVDWGTIDVSMIFDPSDDPPIDQAAESTTITWPDGATWVGSAFMTNYSATGPYDDLMTADATLKISGGITVTSG